MAIKLRSIPPRQRWVPPVEPPTEAELSYKAGYFDADGCVTGQNYRRRHEVEFKVTVAGVIRQRLEEFEEAFGGSIVVVHEPGDQHHPGAARSTGISYQWCASGKAADRCVRALLPYLRSKRPQAETLLKARSTFQKPTGPRRRISQETWDARVALLECVKGLNHRGDYA